MVNQKIKDYVLYSFVLGLLLTIMAMVLYVVEMISSIILEYLEIVDPYKQDFITIICLSTMTTMIAFVLSMCRSSKCNCE